MTNDSICTYPNAQHLAKLTYINEKQGAAHPHIGIEIHAVPAEENEKFFDCLSSNDIASTSAECDSSEQNSERIFIEKMTIKNRILSKITQSNMQKLGKCFLKLLIKNAVEILIHKGLEHVVAMCSKEAGTLK